MIMTRISMPPDTSIVLLGIVLLGLCNGQVLLHGSPIVGLDPFPFNDGPSPLMGFLPMGNLRRARPALDADAFVVDSSPLRVAEIIGTGPADFGQVWNSESADKLNEAGPLALIQSANPFMEQMGRFMEKMFNPFALLPDPFMEFLPKGSRFEVPNVTLSDSDCLVTVDLEGDSNQTAIRVYGAPEEIIVEVTKTQTFGEPGSEPAEGEEAVDELSSIFSLRGAISQFTTVRSFPAPPGCNMTAESSKATIDKDKNQLLIKFPKIPGAVTPEDVLDDSVDAKETAGDEPGVVKPERPAQAGAETISDKPMERANEDAAIVRSALDVENAGKNPPQLVKTTSSKGEPPASGSSWWRSMFGAEGSKPAAAARRSGVKVPVPIVRYDEF